jgi:hypothetical protein
VCGLTFSQWNNWRVRSSRMSVCVGWYTVPNYVPNGTTRRPQNRTLLTSTVALSASPTRTNTFAVDSSWNVMAHGDGREGKWGGGELANVVGKPVPFTLPRNMVCPALLPLLPLMRTTRLPVVDWTDAPADLNELVRCDERLNLVSARAPSHFNWSLPSNL